MRFNQATQSPLVLDVGDAQLSVPKFTMRDVAAWCAEIDKERLRAATEGMEPMQRFHTLNSFDVFPADPAEIVRRLRTPAGMEKVCVTCLSRAKPLSGGDPIGEAKAREILDANPDGWAWLTGQLADVRDQSRPVEPAKGEDGGEGEDPLPPTGNGESTA